MIWIMYMDMDMEMVYTGGLQHIYYVQLINLAQKNKKTVELCDLNSVELTYNIHNRNITVQVTELSVTY